MYEIVKLLFDICLFKKSPRDMPYSLWLLRLLAVTYAIVRFLTLAIDGDKLTAILQIVVEIALTCGFSWLMLYIERKLSRFYQVTSALLGTDAVINFLALPGLATLALGHGGWFLFVFMLALTAWQCAVIAHIIYHALEKKILYSFGLAFLYLLASYQVITLLFPEVAITE
jgi:hypothetical protein